MAEQTERTWTCHVCGRVRPDRLIAVHSRTVTLVPGLVNARENIRYCADSRYCTEAAATLTWLKPTPTTTTTTAVSV